MNAVLLDTNVVSFFMKDHPYSQWYRTAVEGKSLTISFMTAGELYEGAYRHKWGAIRMAELKATLNSYVVIPHSIEICEAWGWIRSERRALPIAVDDAWIAATALVHGYPLVTHNPTDFAWVRGLQLITASPPKK